jgi:hypothetical protein
MAPGPEPDMAVERCRREIAEIERLLRAGHPDLEGLTACAGGLVGGAGAAAAELSRAA